MVQTGDVCTDLSSGSSGRVARWPRATAACVVAAGLALGGCGAANRGPGPTSGDPTGTGSEPAATNEPGETTAPGPDAGAGAGAGAAAATGPSAPNFTLPSLDGKKVRLSDHLGKKVILVDFWHTTCHPCIKEMPELVKLQHKYRDQGFLVIGITTDGPETRADVTAVVRNNKIDFPILIDEETAVQDRYNPKGDLPFTVLINRQGAIVLKRSSYQAGDKKSMQQLVDAIEQALAQGR